MALLVAIVIAVLLARAPEQPVHAAEGQPPQAQREASIRKHGGSYALGYEHGCRSQLATRSVLDQWFERDRYLYQQDALYREGWNDGYTGRDC